MSTMMVGIIGLVILIVLLFLEIPVAVTMGIVGIVGMGYIAGWGTGLDLLKIVPFATAGNYELSVIPLFLLMGSLCFYAGVSEDLYFTVYKWLGQFRGGLAMATIGGCAAFAAVSGSSTACAACMGSVSLPEMKRYRYNISLATGCIAAGGTLGILIPPSIIMVIYAMLTEQSIGKLFLAGFFPGILQAILYIITIYIVCKRNPLMGPAGPRANFKEKVISLKGTWKVLLLFLVVMGGIYLGIFSPTEAAAVGAFGALVLALGTKRLTWKKFTSSLLETGESTAMTLIILIGAMLLGYFLAITRLPFDLANLVSGFAINRYIILSVIILIYIFLGCIMSSMAMIILTVPVFLPLLMSLGFDAIWFGIIIVTMTEIGAITPPVGVNVFIIKAVAKDVPLDTIFRGIVPFFFASLVHVAILVAFPQISLFLPNLMK